MSTRPDPQDQEGQPVLLGRWDHVLPEALPDPASLVGLPVRDAQGRLVGRVVHAQIDQEGLQLHADLDGLALQFGLPLQSLREDRAAPSSRQSE